MGPPVFLDTLSNFYDIFLLNILQVFLIIQTQDIVKQTHHTLKLQIKKLKKGNTQVHYCLPYLKQTLLDSNVFSKPITIVNTVLFVLNSFFNLFGRFDPRGPPAFKMEMKQQEPQEEEIPVWAVSTLKISRKHSPWRHHPDDLPTWGQIKTLTNQAENLVSQQGLPPSPEYILLAMLSLLACTSPCSSLD